MVRLCTREKLIFERACRLREGAPGEVRYCLVVENERCPATAISVELGRLRGERQVCQRAVSGVVERPDPFTVRDARLLKRLP
jgi:hypothetical protein